MRLTLWTLAVCALLTAASAQITYQEQGDAGDLPETAQATGTDTNTALGAIRGTLEANGVDMYVIYIADPANFSATTVTTRRPSTPSCGSLTRKARVWCSTTTRSAQTLTVPESTTARTA